MIHTENHSKDTIEAIEAVTIQIAEIIKSSDDVQDADDMFISDAISDLYDQRQVLLERFNSWYYSPSGQIELREDKEVWNARINDLKKADTILVENIQRKMKEAQIRLRTFQQQKSLLIYSKR